MIRRYSQIFSANRSDHKRHKHLLEYISVTFIMSLELGQRPPTIEVVIGE